MKNMLKKSILAMCALAITMLFASCENNTEVQEQDDDTEVIFLEDNTEVISLKDNTEVQEPKSILEKAKQTGKLVVYTNPAFPPYEYLDENGNITGVEMELVEKIGEKLGVKIEYVPTDFDSILMSVAKGKADIGASGFTINKERKRKIDFSHPFVVSIQHMITSDQATCKTIENLAGKTIGCQLGTTGSIMIENAIKKGVLQGKNTTLKLYDTITEAVGVLLRGNIDAVVIDELVAISLTNSTTGLKTVPLVTTDGKGLDVPEEFGMILAKGNDDLMAIINEVIDTAKADGSLQASFDKHRNITEKKK